MINPQVLSLIKREAKLFDSLQHGLPHWKSVERNGLYLAQFTGADPKVVVYFAYFHDCMRQNEFDDPEHGPRAAKYLKQHKDRLNLNDDQFRNLLHAVSGHTHARKEINKTISTCWDADRLDIGRVGIPPMAKYMFSDEAKRIADTGDEQVLCKFGFVTQIY